jgi:hypothetical protein
MTLRALREELARLPLHDLAETNCTAVEQRGQGLWLTVDTSLFEAEVADAVAAQERAERDVLDLTDQLASTRKELDKALELAVTGTGLPRPHPEIFRHLGSFVQDHYVWHVYAPRPEGQS